LKQRLSELDAQASMRERVRAVLLETLPAGISSIDAVAQRLAVSKRSLQRQLAEESVGFQEVLSEVRQALAQHYLRRTDISAGEISWLLGFQESNSFIRAFRSWTGTTPAAYREGRLGLGSGVH
jgi:AraC-like DNA-binding protein